MRKTIGLALVVWLAYSASPLLAAEQLVPDHVKRLVNLFDVGTDVRVTLDNKKTLEGAIRCFGPEGFILVFQDGRMESILYEDVSQLRARNLTYKASANQRGATARSVAAGLGSGTIVTVKTSRGGSLTGRIVEVREQSIELLPNEGIPLTIAYRDIQELGTSESRAKAIFIIAFVLMFQAH